MKSPPMSPSLNVHCTRKSASREQRERDALVLTNEIAHRVKNNLQITVALIALEAKSAATPCVGGYRAMQARIGAIAELYDLISQTSDGHAIALDAYLGEIARTMSDSLLESTSGIKIEVKSRGDGNRPDSCRTARPAGNELATTPSSTLSRTAPGTSWLSAESDGDQIELTVADDGAGMKEKYSARITGKPWFRLRGDLRASDWRHDRDNQRRRNWNRRENTFSLADRTPPEELRGRAGDLSPNIAVSPR